MQKRNGLVFFRYLCFENFTIIVRYKSLPFSLDRGTERANCLPLHGGLYVGSVCWMQWMAIIDRPISVYLLPVFNHQLPVGSVDSSPFPAPLLSNRKTWFVKNLLILIYLYTHSSAVCNQISKPSSVVYVALPGRISFFLFQRQKLLHLQMQ